MTVNLAVNVTWECETDANSVVPVKTNEWMFMRVAGCQRNRYAAAAAAAAAAEEAAA